MYEYLQSIILSTIRVTATVNPIKAKTLFIAHYFTGSITNENACFSPFFIKYGSRTNA